MVVEKVPRDERDEISPLMEEIDRLLAHSTYLVHLSAEASRRADEATRRLRKAIDDFTLLSRQMQRGKPSD